MHIFDVEVTESSGSAPNIGRVLNGDDLNVEVHFKTSGIIQTNYDIFTSSVVMRRNYGGSTTFCSFSMSSFSMSSFSMGSVSMSSFSMSMTGSFGGSIGGSHLCYRHHMEDGEGLEVLWWLCCLCCLCWVYCLRCPSCRGTVLVTVEVLVFRVVVVSVRVSLSSSGSMSVSSLAGVSV